MLEVALIALVLGTTFGVVRNARRHHWGHHHGHCGQHRDRVHWGPPRGEAPRRGWGGGYDGRFVRAAGEVWKRRLKIDEDQEGIVDHAIADLKDAMKTLHGELTATRADLARAFRGDDVDDGAVAAVFSRQDEAISQARRDVVSALKQVHAVLDPAQREQALSWVADPDDRWI